MNQEYPKDLPVEAVALLWDKVRGKPIPLSGMLHAAWIVLGYALCQLAPQELPIFASGEGTAEISPSGFDPREAETVLEGMVDQSIQVGPATWLLLIRLALWIIGSSR